MPTESHPGLYALTKYWDIATLRWVKGTQPSGGGGGGGAVTVADGADVTQGALADAAVITDTTGTLSGKLRGLVKWAFERMPASLGQKTAAASLPVVIASDQSAVKITGFSGQAAIVVTATTPLDVAIADSSTVDIKKMGGVATSMNTGVRDAGTQRVTLATNDAIQVNAGTNLNTSALSLEATQLLVKAKTDNLDVLLSTRLKPADTLAGVTTVTTVTTVATVTTVGAVTAITNALPVGANVIGKVSIDQTTPGTTNKVDVGTMANVVVAMNTGTRAAGVQRVTICTDDLVPISAPTLTKATQGATGFSTQDLKDAGRNVTNIFMAAPIITTVAEVMQSFVAYKSGAAVGATATPAVVTAGKTYRVNSVEITYWAATAIGGALVRWRVLTSGVALIGSPLFKTFQVGVPAIFTAGSAMTYVYPYPDGIEFAAGTGIAFGVQGVGADGTTGTITGKIMIVVNGYEY